MDKMKFEKDVSTAMLISDLHKLPLPNCRINQCGMTASKCESYWELVKKEAALRLNKIN